MLIAVITIDPDGYVILRNRLDRLEQDRHLAGLVVEIDTGEGDGETIVTGQIHYGLCEIVGSLREGWDSVFCRRIPKGGGTGPGSSLGTREPEGTLSEWLSIGTAGP